MNVQSNLYTFIYASVMVILVALGLSVASITLKDKQEKNRELEKMQSILASVNIDCPREKADEYYKKYIKNTYVVDYEGNKIDGADAFKIDLKAELKKPENQRYYPVYEAEKDGHKLYILPVRGTGLWGPIWGFIALKDDMNTIYGVTFDHEGETPGLGAEITTKAFRNQFVGKTIFDENGNYVSVKVMKHGTADNNNPHQVDGLTGATLTSNGVSNMLLSSLGAYKNFLEKNRK